MSRALVPLLFFALLLSGPAVSEDQGPGDQIRHMQAEIDLLNTRLDKQEALLTDVVKILKARKEAAKSLAADLQKAEQDGFTYPAPNTSAKVALLAGLQSYAKSASAHAPGESASKNSGD